MYKRGGLEQFFEGYDEPVQGRGILDFIDVSGGAEMSENEVLNTKLNDSECSELVDIGKSGGVCLSKKSLKALADVVHVSDEDPKKVIEHAKKKYNCDTELCVAKKAVRDVFNDELKQDIVTRFKTIGPRDNPKKFLNNFDIDGVLLRWMREFKDFMACPFAMRDFDSTHETFSTLSLPDVYKGDYAIDTGITGTIKRKNKTFACVLNTDYSTGRGKHWVAVFVDMRDAANAMIFYFNSVGNKPFKEIVIWEERTRAEMLASKLFENVKIINVTTVAHQKENVVCGIYSLYFIRRMLEGTPYTFFMDENNTVSDATMDKFRRYLFHA